MARLFGDSVPRALYDDMRHARDTWQQECALLRAEHIALMREVVAIKRHDLGLPPAGFEPKDPASVLGPKTLAAVEQMSAGYADVRSHLTNWAITQANALGPDSDGLDDHLAQAIKRGDT